MPLKSGALIPREKLKLDGPGPMEPEFDPHFLVLLMTSIVVSPHQVPAQVMQPVLVSTPANIMRISEVLVFIKNVNIKITLIIELYNHATESARNWLNL